MGEGGGLFGGCGVCVRGGSEREGKPINLRGQSMKPYLVRLYILLQDTCIRSWHLCEPRAVEGPANPPS